MADVQRPLNGFIRKTNLFFVFVSGILLANIASYMWVLMSEIYKIPEVDEPVDIHICYEQELLLLWKMTVKCMVVVSRNFPGFLIMFLVIIILCVIADIYYRYQYDKLYNLSRRAQRSHMEQYRSVYGFVPQIFTEETA